MRRSARIVPATLIGLLLAAQAAESPAQERDVELRERLAQSEAKAAALQQRLEELERRVQALGAAAPVVAPPAAVRPAVNAQAAPPPSASPAQAPAPSSSGRTAAARSAPGTFEVDEEAAQRALERTLTQTGALLLPVGTVEATPSFTYRRFEQTNPALVSDPSGTVVLGNQLNRRNEYTAALELRAGLPYNSQLELVLPYSHVHTSQVTPTVSGPAVDRTDSASGTGDVTLGFAKTLMRESGWKPDLIGRLTYNFGNGDRQSGGVSLNGGFRQLTAEVVALKRQDPLAFVGTAFYGKAFEEDRIDPGNSAGFSLAALLAASPATSLQLGFSQIYRQKQEIGGVRLPGTDQSYGIMTLGASSVLSRDLTLVTQFGIGLGNDAPKYSFTISLPILFR
ncbi:hypothetical protein [Noviherbaspirillum massiliense]|uniref:hypothetical protein n=1 Tax=Noviherbaspirillum massiliense TaxID=1465823 RepID=UPI0011DC8384|nr:hypothetical protein [Noviherbaspirillum massiliense]